jgi:hypothetical protein
MLVFKPTTEKDREEQKNIQTTSYDILSISYVKIWNQEVQLPQNLETLEVRSCDSLINLAPSTSSYRNLTALLVWDYIAQKIHSRILSLTALFLYLYL